MKPAISSTRRTTQRGNAFMEFAIVVPVMVLLLFGVVDYSRVFYYAQIVNSAARVGTQVAMLGPQNQNTLIMTETANAQADSASVPSSMNFTATASQWCQCAGTTGSVTCNPGSCAGEMYTYAQVNTSLTFTTLFQYPVLPTSMTLQGQSIVRVQ